MVKALVRPEFPFAAEKLISLVSMRKPLPLSLPLSYDILWESTGQTKCHKEGRPPVVGDAEDCGDMLVDN